MRARSMRRDSYQGLRAEAKIRGPPGRRRTAGGTPALHRWASIVAIACCGKVHFMNKSLGYSAPFAPGGESAIDAATCERLLAVAMSRGGAYADLFFEYRVAGGLSYDEGILKAA